MMFPLVLDLAAEKIPVAVTCRVQSPLSPSLMVTSRNSGVGRARDKHTKHPQPRQFVSRPCHASGG